MTPNARQICCRFPPLWHLRLCWACAWFLASTFSPWNLVLVGSLITPKKPLVHKTSTGPSNCSLNPLPPLVWYSKGLAYSTVLLELHQGWSLPKGAFKPLVNSWSSIFRALLVHIWLPVINIELPSGKKKLRASLSLAWCDNQAAHGFMR